MHVVDQLKEKVDGLAAELKDLIYVGKRLRVKANGDRGTDNAVFVHVIDTHREDDKITLRLSTGIDGEWTIEHSHNLMFKTKSR